MSAIQVAKTMGAKIVATAGSSSKRQVLRNAGVKSVLGSRDTHFASTLPQLGECRSLFLVTELPE